MTTLHPRAHAFLAPGAPLTPLSPSSPARVAALGFALGLTLSLALLPLARQIGSEPSPTPTRARRAPSRPLVLAPTLAQQASKPARPAPPALARATTTPPLTSQPSPSHAAALLPESEIAEELYAGELPEADVEAGLAQAEALCLRVRELGHGAWEALPVDAIRRLLRAPAIEAESYGELPAIHSELAWIEGLRSSADLGRRSLEDLRFLAAAIHWYLEGASEPLTGAAKHLDRPAEFDPEGLREFAGMDFADLLAEWD